MENHEDEWLATIHAFVNDPSIATHQQFAQHITKPVDTVEILVDLLVELVARSGVDAQFSPPPMDEEQIVADYFGLKESGNNNATHRIIRVADFVDETSRITRTGDVALFVTNPLITAMHESVHIPFRPVFGGRKMGLCCVLIASGTEPYLLVVEDDGGNECAVVLYGPDYRRRCRCARNRGLTHSMINRLCNGKTNLRVLAILCDSHAPTFPLLLSSGRRDKSRAPHIWGAFLPRLLASFQ